MPSAMPWRSMAMLSALRTLASLSGPRSTSSMLMENMLGGLMTLAVFSALMAGMDSGGTRSTTSTPPVSRSAMRAPSSGATVKSIALRVAG